MKRLSLTVLTIFLLISCSLPVERISSGLIIDDSVDNSLIEIEPFPEAEMGIDWDNMGVSPYGIQTTIKKYEPPPLETTIYLNYMGQVDKQNLANNGYAYYDVGNEKYKVLRYWRVSHITYYYYSWDTNKQYPYKTEIIYTYHADLESPPTATYTPTDFMDNRGFIAPCIVIDRTVNPDNSVTTVYRMWYTEYNRVYIDDPATYYHSYNEQFISRYAESYDNGQSWNTVSSDLLNGLTPTANLNDKGGIIISDVKKIGGNYFMWYLGKDEISGEERTWRIYMAIYDSALRQWERISGGDLNLVKDLNIDGFDSDNLGKCSAIYERSRGLYRLWYCGNDGNGDKIGYSESRNPLYWSSENNEIYKGKAARFDSYQVSDPTVIKDGDIYKMWYSGYDDIQWRIGLAYSWDGRYFEYFDESHLPLEIVDPAQYEIRYPYVIHDEGKYKIWYSLRDRTPGAADDTWKIGYAESSAP